MVTITKNNYGLFVRQLEHGIKTSKNIGTKTQVEQSNTASITHYFRPPEFANQIPWYSSFITIVEKAIENQIIHNAIVHGSYGDNTTTAFSDLEVTLILNDEFFQSNYSNYIKKIRPWLKTKFYPLILRIDPLQHHGAFYLWKQLIHHYNESILPLSVYNHSWSVRPQEVKFYIQEQADVSHDSLSLTLQSLRNFQKTFFRRGMNPYSIKRMLSNIMLVPAFYYQQRGIMMTKPEAINQIKVDNPIAGEMMARASAFRCEWQNPPAWLGQIRSFINQGYIPSARWDILLVHLYQDKALLMKFQREILPMIPQFCRSFEVSSERKHETSKST